MKNLKRTLSAVALALNGLSLAHAGTQDEYRDFAGHVGDEVRGRYFEALDREADQYRRDRSRLSDGRWKLADGK